MATIVTFWIFEILLNTETFYIPKLQNNYKSVNNSKFLIIFIQKIENLTANSFFHNFYDNAISADVT